MNPYKLRKTQKPSSKSGQETGTKKITRQNSSYQSVKKLTKKIIKALKYYKRKAN